MSKSSFALRKVLTFLPSGHGPMESLQRLAALPLVDNACASRANRDSWSYSVFCREVLPAEAEDPDAMLRGRAGGMEVVEQLDLKDD